MDSKKNKLTLLIDGNWLLISRASVLMNSFKKDLPLGAKQQSQEELADLLAKSICTILSRIPSIDNIILMADGGSWRKQLSVPKSIEGTLYKGNRTVDNDIEWSYIYNALNGLIEKAREEGITVSQYNNIEGDDWAWYWSRRLNSDGINCLIWSSDNDLKQLIQIDNDTRAFTAWYNDKNGIWMHESIKESDNEMDFFMQPHYYSPVLESLKNKIPSQNYINPDDVVMSKIICGDAGDNILPIMRYQKGERNYRITEKDWSSIKDDLMQINNINDFLEHTPGIIWTISEHKKFKPYKPDLSTLNEMIAYNTKLVWLNESTIPDTIIQFMNQQEYKKFDVGYLRSNYKVLVKENDDIQNLFESI